MSASTFDELAAHVGHTVEVVTYGNPISNVAVECETCSVVLLDFDAPGSAADELEKVAARLAHPSAPAALSDQARAESGHAGFTVPERFPQHQLGDVLVYSDPDCEGSSNFAVCLECGARAARPLEPLPLDAVLRFAVGHECVVEPAPLPDPGILTGAEHEVLDLLGQAASSYATNVVGFDARTRFGDVDEFCSRIHDLQARVMMQAAARAYPDRYRLAGGPPPTGKTT